MTSGSQILLTCNAPAAARAGGDIVKAKAALAEIFQSHSQTRQGLDVFGLKIDKIFIGKDDSPRLDILFIAFKDTPHVSSDAIGFFSGI